MAIESGDAAMSVGVTEDEALIDLEREVWSSIVQGNLNRFADLLAPDVLYIDESGEATKARLLELVRGVRMTSFALRETRVFHPGGGAVVVVYRCDEEFVRRDTGEQAHLSKHCSSLWVQRDESPVLLFHQETPIADL
jgi:hypothetical protein